MTSGEKRHRAVLRAPEPIQKLYRRGLIGEREATLFGPPDPSAEKAAVIAEVVQEVQRVAESCASGGQHVGLTRCAINAIARDTLGRHVDPVDRLEEAYYELSEEDRRRFLARIDKGGPGPG